MSVPPELYQLPSLEIVLLRNNPILADDLAQLDDHLNASRVNVGVVIAILVVVVAICGGFIVYQRRRSSA